MSVPNPPPVPGSRRSTSGWSRSEVGQQHAPGETGHDPHGHGGRGRRRHWPDYGAAESERWWRWTFTSRGSMLSSTCRAAVRHRCHGPGSASLVDDASRSGAMSCILGHAASTSPPNAGRPNLVEDPLNIRVSHGHEPADLAADMARLHDAANNCPNQDRRATAAVLICPRRGKLRRFRWLACHSTSGRPRTPVREGRIAREGSTPR